MLSVDDYTRGVVAGEMPSSWPMEALKAQAVTARTYALATRKTGGTFDLYPDTRSQVYRGVTAESVRSDAAVRATAGRILTYSGAPAVTYYFSTSGGHTESIQFSFVGALSKPWLVGVTDPYDSLSPYHRWRASFTTGQLTRALGARGSFRRLKVLKRGTSPRIVKAEVIGTKGSTTDQRPDHPGAARAARHLDAVHADSHVRPQPPQRTSRRVGRTPRAGEPGGQLHARAARETAHGRAPRGRSLAPRRHGPHLGRRSLPDRRRGSRRVSGAGRRGGRARRPGALTAT